MFSTSTPVAPVFTNAQLEIVFGGVSPAGAKITSPKLITKPTLILPAAAGVFAHKVAKSALALGATAGTSALLILNE